MEIKTSKVRGAGNGVFVTSDYKEGDYVCFYDGKDVPRGIAENMEQEYVVLDTGMVRVGYKASEVCHPTGVGQLINDGAMMALPPPSSSTSSSSASSSASTSESKSSASSSSGAVGGGFERMKKQIEIYNAVSKAKANVAFEAPAPGKKNNYTLRATKSIKAGEELYLHYGQGYWLNKLLVLSENTYKSSGATAANALAAAKHKFFYSYFFEDFAKSFQVILKSDKQSKKFINNFLGLKLDSPIWGELKCRNVRPAAKLMVFAATIIGN